MRIAILIPAHNDASMLATCLEHISLQTRLPNEVVVVDNRSDEDINSVCDTYSFVRIVTESTLGICAATKRGFDAAADSADILLRCDTDSKPGKDWVRRIVAGFDDKNVVAVTGPGEFYGITGMKKWLAQLVYMRLYFAVVFLALGQRPLFGSNCAIRASTWKAISNSTHLSRQDIHDDMDISYHVVKEGRIMYDPKLLMPISARPFTSLKSLLNRVPMGLRSIVIHWPSQAPWRR